MRKQIPFRTRVYQDGDRRRVRRFAWLPKIVSRTWWKWWIWLEFYWQWQTYQTVPIDVEQVGYWPAWVDDNSVKGRELYD